MSQQLEISAEPTAVFFEIADQTLSILHCGADLGAASTLTDVGRALAGHQAGHHLSAQLPLKSHEHTASSLTAVFEDTPVLAARLGCDWLSWVTPSGQAVTSVGLRKPILAPAQVFLIEVKVN